LRRKLRKLLNLTQAKKKATRRSLSERAARRFILRCLDKAPNLTCLFLLPIEKKLRFLRKLLSGADGITDTSSRQTTRRAPVPFVGAYVKDAKPFKN